MALRDVLHFPPSDRAFLDPYLPPTSTATATTTTDTTTTTTTTIPRPTRPFTTLTFATSLDSALALAPSTPTPLSGPASKAMTHYLRARHDAILVGVGTALADDPSLNCRLAGAGVQGQPRPVVLDPRARWDVAASRALGLARAGRGRAPWVVVAADVDARQREALEAGGGAYLTLPAAAASAPAAREPAAFAWEDVLALLAARGIASVMVEGGGAVINALLLPQHAPLVDAVVVTIAPTWLGRGGVVVSPQRTVDATGVAVPPARLRRVRWHQLGEDVVLCGTLRGGAD
ncbi:hypothetical protein B0A49_10273 [Cryomyces minteri]|uniref:2,5-diamino-6-ribosylamino-4(3H)-pyrimidinone 5'-phosphate reductase n=1 Tax=Cryomyces minteri TaxID=331657 RepID=A0A4V5ND69_9PEZI|nr:hypothetical protein B0A49_10273 [Cryomyces minteri]